MLAEIGLLVGAVVGYVFMGTEGAFVCGLIGLFMGAGLDAQSDK